MTKFKDLTGQTFNQLTVIKRVENKYNDACWLCKCTCGKETIVTTQRLTKGLTKSCGCLRSIVAINKNKTHNLSNTKIYKTWQEMKKRCYNSKYKRYKDYGGRGIIICNEWLNDFKTFYDWSMNNGYKEDLTIDRINVNGNYEPSNCRWASIKIQSNNKRNNRIIEYKGELHTMSEWANIYNINYKLLHSRLKKGWDIEKALFTKKFTCAESGKLGGQLSHKK